MENAGRNRRLHRLGHVRTDLPRRRLEVGRRAACVPVRRIRRGGGKSGGERQFFLCDGHAAAAEAMQAASLSEVLEVDATMELFSSTFELPIDQERDVMKLGPGALSGEQRERYEQAIRNAEESNIARCKRVLRA